VESDRGPIESLSAVTIVTRSMAVSVAFYEALGFRRLYGGADEAFTSFRVGNGFLNLQLSSVTVGEVWGRVVFWVDDVDAMYQRAVAAGFTPATTPVNATWGERYFHIHDPDGHELSFARPVGG